MDFTPAQIKTLERLLAGGFQFVTFEKYPRFVGVERDGFVSLLEPAGGRLTPFGSPGYLFGSEIGVLLQRNDEKVFVCHKQEVAATDQMLQQYDQFKVDLAAHLDAVE